MSLSILGGLELLAKPLSQRRLISRGDYNWACFKAEQAAECALECLLRGLGVLYDTDSLVSMLARLLEGLDPSSIMQAASELDKFLPANTLS